MTHDIEDYIVLEPKTPDQIISLFSAFSTWEERYAYLLKLAAKLPPMKDTDKTDDFLLPGCTSKVWFLIRRQNNNVYISADSDVKIIKGLIALIFMVANGQSIDWVDKTDFRDLFQQLQLADHLAPNRRNGFFSMIQAIKTT